MKWDDIPIDDLCVCRIVLWNRGKTPLGQDRLPSSDPLRIVPDHAVRFLAVEPTNTSRPTLTLQTRIDNPRAPGAAGGQVLLGIAGGDALEQDEGVAVRVLFAGNCAFTGFSVPGRVIRAPKGFRKSNEGLARSAWSEPQSSGAVYMFAALTFFFFVTTLVVRLAVGMSGERLPSWLGL